MLLGCNCWRLLCSWWFKTVHKWHKMETFARGVTEFWTFITKIAEMFWMPSFGKPLPMFGNLIVLYCIINKYLLVFSSCFSETCLLSPVDRCSTDLSCLSWYLPVDVLQTHLQLLLHHSAPSRVHSFCLRCILQAWSILAGDPQLGLSTVRYKEPNYDHLSSN